MATLTPNLGLYKPDRNEYVSVISDLNNNFDILDDANADVHDAIIHSDDTVDITSRVESISCAASVVQVTISNYSVYKSGNTISIEIVASIVGSISQASLMSFYIDFDSEDLRPIARVPMCVNGIDVRTGCVRSGVNDSPSHHVVFDVIATNELTPNPTIPYVVGAVYVCHGDDNVIEPVLENVTPTLIADDDYSMNFS